MLTMSSGGRGAYARGAVALFIAGMAGVAHGQGVINAATTVADIEYRRNAAGPITALFGPAVGPQWAAPNFLTSGVFTDNQPFANSPNFNTGSTAVRFDVVNPFPGIAPLGTAIQIPQATFFGQTDPQGALPRSSLRINFQIDIFTPAGNAPFTFQSLPGFYALNFNIPQGSFGQFDAQINYTSLATGLVVQPQQNMNFGGAGFFGAGVANLAFPGGPGVFVAGPGDGVRVSGFIQFQVDNETGAVNLELVPAPGALALLGVGGVVATRRRRA